MKSSAAGQSLVACPSMFIPPAANNASHSSHADPLVHVFFLLNRLYEKGAPMPFLFPETVCYEHHFPRGWYSLEKEPPSAAALRLKDGPELDPMEKLKATNAFLRPTARFSGSSGEGTKKSAPPAANNLTPGSACDGMILVKRSSKDCDSTAIRKAFANTKQCPVIASILVSRDAGSRQPCVRYLDNASIGEALMNTPETCILSKSVPSSKDRFDVIFASWTPSVFSIEHRMNHHLLADEGLTVQERGETENVAKYKELQTCPLTAKRIREQMYLFVWALETYERRQVTEMRACFRPDKNDKLWFLWADVLRFAPQPTVVAPNSGLLPLTPRAYSAEDCCAIWDEIEKEVEQRKVAEKRKSEMARITGTGPAQSRAGESDEDKERRLSRVRYGRHPSFTKPEMEASMDVLMTVESQLHGLLQAAKGKQATPDRSRKLPALPSPSSDGQSSANNSSKRSLGKTSTKGSAMAKSFVARKVFEGTPWGEPNHAGLKPMIPLTLLPDHVEWRSQSAPLFNDDAVEPLGRSVDEGFNPSGVRPLDTHDLSQSASMRTTSTPAGAVTFANDPFASFATSPAFGNSPSNGSETAASPLGQGIGRRRSTMTIAKRGDDPSTPSSWMKTVKHLSSEIKPLETTPRKAREDRAEVQQSRDRTSSFFTYDRKDSTPTESERQQAIANQHFGIRPFVPSVKRQQRSRASVVMQKQSDYLDLTSRLQYGELKRNHSAGLEEIDDILYYCLSEELKSREKDLPILFDIPKGIPPVESKLMKSLGFSVVAENPELDRIYFEKYYVKAHTVNLLWAFEHLKAAAEDLCHEEEVRFFLNVDNEMCKTIGHESFNVEDD